MRPLILVSNDDSFAARGVHALIDNVTALGDVVAVCPQTPQSAQSMALTVNAPLRVNRLDDYNGARMYNVTGTPVDCIKMAMHHILDRRPDIVVTGINHGSNASINEMYSGTMGAAIEGAAFGIPSAGFSLTDHSPTADFAPCTDAIQMIVKGMLEHGLPEFACLNVNVPNLHERPEQMRICTPCHGRWNDEYKEYVDPFGGKFYWMSGHFENLEPDNENTDEWALRHGFISVVTTMAERSGSGIIPEIDWLRKVCEHYNKQKSN